MNNISIEDLKGQIFTIVVDIYTQYNKNIDNNKITEIINNYKGDQYKCIINLFDYIQSFDKNNIIIELLCNKLENYFKSLDFKKLDDNCKKFCLSKKWEDKKDKGISNTFKFSPYKLADYFINLANNYNYTINYFFNLKNLNKVILNNNDMYGIISEFTTFLLLKYKYNININNIYVYIDSEFEYWLYQFFGLSIDHIKKIKNWRNIGDSLDKMEFDKIIMNPPYSKNLHLKILEYVTKNNIKINGVCINLSPIRWLQDVFAETKIKKSDYKKYEESLAKHFENINIITARDAQQFFPGTVMNIDLAIYKWTNSNTYLIYKTIPFNSILLKCIDYLKYNNPKFERNKLDGWRVRIPDILGGLSNGSGHRKPVLRSFGKLLVFFNGLKENKPWYTWFKTNQYSKTTTEITQSIKFNDELQANNFCNSLQTNFGKYITHKVICDVNTSEKQILWMANAINPRTKLLGYNSDWIDQDFYTFFNITKEEQEEIVELINSYLKK